jgi:hypothetical protein
MALIDRRTGARHPANSEEIDQFSASPGVFSPDGVHAAIVLPNRSSPTGLSLRDVPAGLSQPILVPGGVRDGNGAMVWSPDGRWLIVTGDTGHLYAVGVDSGIRDLGLDLPPVGQLAVRTTTAPLS